MKKFLSIVLALAVVMSCLTICLTANAADNAAKFTLTDLPGFKVLAVTDEKGPFSGLKDADFANGVAEIDVVITNETNGKIEVAMSDNWGTDFYATGSSNVGATITGTQYKNTRVTVEAGATTVVTFTVPKVCDAYNKNGDNTTVNKNMSYKNIGFRFNGSTTGTAGLFMYAIGKADLNASLAGFTAYGASSAAMPTAMAEKIADLTKTFAAGVLTNTNAGGYAITKTGIFKGVDFGDKAVKEVSFGAYLDGAAETTITQFQVCFEWGSNIYEGFNAFDADKWNTAAMNKAWNTLNPDKTQKTVDKYLEDGNHPVALGGTQASLGIKGGEGTTFTLNVPKEGTIVNFQTRYMVIENEATKAVGKFTDGTLVLESSGSLPAALKDLEANKDYAEFKYVTSCTNNAFTDFGLRINGIKEKDAKVVVVCLSDPSVNTNIARATSYTGFGAISGLDDKAALTAATSAEFVKLLEAPAPTAVPLDPTAKPTAKPAATPIVKDAYEIDATKMTLGQLVKAKAGITTLPDGNNTVKYTVYNPNDFDIVVSLMMQTGTNNDVCLEGSSGYEAGKENKCAEGWRFVRDAEGKPLNEKFVTVKAGKSADITFTFPVKDNKVVCDFCGNSHDVSTLYVRFDCFTAEKEGETGYKKMTTGSFKVLKTENATLDGYLAALASANNFVTTSTVEIPVASGDMMPVALIACVAVAATALVVVSKKRKED